MHRSGRSATCAARNQHRFFHPGSTARFRSNCRGHGIHRFQIGEGGLSLGLGNGPMADMGTSTPKGTGRLQAIDEASGPQELTCQCRRSHELQHTVFAFQTKIARLQVPSPFRELGAFEEVGCCRWRGLLSSASIGPVQACHHLTVGFVQSEYRHR